MSKERHRNDRVETVFRDDFAACEEVGWFLVRKEAAIACENGERGIWRSLHVSG